MWECHPASEERCRRNPVVLSDALLCDDFRFFFLLCCYTFNLAERLIGVVFLLRNFSSPYRFLY